MVEWRKKQRFEDHLRPRPHGIEVSLQYPEDEEHSFRKNKIYNVDETGIHTAQKRKPDLRDERSERGFSSCFLK
jgi:hypothetical protein